MTKNLVLKRISEPRPNPSRSFPFRVVCLHPVLSASLNILLLVSFPSLLYLACFPCYASARFLPFPFPFLTFVSACPFYFNPITTFLLYILLHQLRFLSTPFFLFLIVFFWSLFPSFFLPFPYFSVFLSSLF